MDIVFVAEILWWDLSCHVFDVLKLPFGAFNKKSLNNVLRGFFVRFAHEINASLLFQMGKIILWGAIE